MLYCRREPYKENLFTSPFLGRDTCVGCIQNDTVYNLLPDKAPQIQDVFRARKTCAVVTYSKCLANYSYGSLIDSNDIVMRFNLHPYENASIHGTKTTHMIINDAFWFPESITYGRLNEIRDLPEAIIFNHFSCDWKCAFTRKTRYFIQEVLKVRKDALILDPLFLQSAFVASGRDAKFHSGKASSGWTGMYLMSHACDVINAFGFCPDIKSDYKKIVHEFNGEHKNYWKWSQRTDAPFKLNMYPSPV